MRSIGQCAVAIILFCWINISVMESLYNKFIISSYNMNFNTLLYYLILASMKNNFSVNNLFEEVLILFYLFAPINKKVPHFVFLFFVFKHKEIKQNIKQYVLFNFVFLWCRKNNNE